VEDLLDLTSGHVGEVVDRPPRRWDRGHRPPSSLTVSKVISLSEVVSPALMPNWLSISSAIACPLRTWQAVPKQAERRCFPLGLRLKDRKKVATPIDIHEGMACLSSDDAQRLFGEITVPCLNVFEDGRSRPPRSFP